MEGQSLNRHVQIDALALSLNRLVAPQTFIRVNAESRVDELAKSVGRIGLLEPLVVRPSRKELGKYEVVCGLRRYLAAKKAGLETVPCIVKEMSDLEALGIHARRKHGTRKPFRLRIGQMV